MSIISRNWALNCCVISLSIWAGFASAETMPAGAKSMTADEIKALFAGKTYGFKEVGKDGVTRDVSWYLASDGSMLGYAQNGPSFASGTWNASEGKLCVSTTWTGSWGTGQANDCQSLAEDEKSSKKLYRAETSKGKDFVAFRPTLHDGNSITASIDALRKKLGK